MEATSERRTLSLPKFFWAIVAYYLIPQIIAVFAVPGVADGGSYETLKGALQFEVVPHIGSALIAGWIIWRLGWIDLVLHERKRTRTWVWIIPVALIAGSLAFTDWQHLADAQTSLVIAMIGGTFTTALNEELMFRGVGLQVMRDRYDLERTAAIWTAIWFGGTHLVGIFLQGGLVVGQVLIATAAGIVLYLCRRVSGGMALPILVHWVYDFSSFSPEVGVEDTAWTGFFNVFLVMCVLLVVVVLKRNSISLPDDKPQTASVS